MTTTTDRSESVAKIAKLIKGIRIAMLTTAETDGTLRSRPMATQEAEFDGTLWFFTSADSPKVDEVEHDQNVNVSYAKPDDQAYVSLSGRARLVRDSAKINELWNPLLKAWFPDGKDDPKLALLNVDVDQAEYWDSPAGGVVALAGFVKAAVTGKPAKGGGNEKVEL